LGGRAGFHCRGRVGSGGALSRGKVFELGLRLAERNAKGHIRSRPMCRMLPFFLGMVVLAGTAGCVGLAVGAAAGAGGYAYYKGELKSAEGYPLDAVWEATQKAVRRLRFTSGSSGWGSAPPSCAFAWACWGTKPSLGRSETPSLAS